MCETKCEVRDNLGTYLDILIHQKIYHLRYWAKATHHGTIPWQRIVGGSVASASSRRCRSVRPSVLVRPYLFLRSRWPVTVSALLYAAYDVQEFQRSYTVAPVILFASAHIPTISDQTSNQAHRRAETSRPSHMQALRSCDSQASLDVGKELEASPAVPFGPPRIPVVRSLSPCKL